MPKLKENYIFVKYFFTLKMWHHITVALHGYLLNILISSNMLIMNESIQKDLWVDFKGIQLPLSKNVNIFRGIIDKP